MSSSGVASPTSCIWRRNRTWIVRLTGRTISSAQTSSARLICSKPAAHVGSQLSTPTNSVSASTRQSRCREQALNPQPAFVFITFRRTRFMVRSARKAISPRRRLARQTRLIPQAKLPATCSCGRIITPTVCRRSSQIARTTTVRINFLKN